MNPKEKVFLFEFACSTSKKLESTVAVEGLGMFKTLNEGFEDPISFHLSDDYYEEFKRYLELADYVLAIAPETEMELYKLTKLIEKSSCQNLGSSSEAVRQTSDKYLSYEKLKDLSPSTELNKGKTSLRFPLIAKPRDGVSCEGIKVVNSEEDLRRVPINYILQEYVRGKPMSASLLIREDEVYTLSINTQEIKGFKYYGAILPVYLPDTSGIIESVNRFRGLHGYIGVDFIMTENGPIILEINPRPTTPIIGLNQAFNINISKMILDNFKGRKIPEIKEARRIHICKKENCKGFANLDGHSILIDEIT